MKLLRLKQVQAMWRVGRLVLDWSTDAAPSSCSHSEKCILCTFCDAKSLARQVAARYL